MKTKQMRANTHEGAAELTAETFWNTLPSPCLVIGPDNKFVAANAAAELFLSQSQSALKKLSLMHIFPETSRLKAFVDEAREGRHSQVEYGVELSWVGHDAVLVDLQAAQLFDAPGNVLLHILPRSVAQSMGRSLTNRGSARSLSGLSAMLAHEIKNPLSGISGAAQLLEMSLGDGEAEMLQLIQEEVERIRLLIDRMDAFGDSGPPQRRPVNIHDVLDQARRSASAGFAQHVRFRESYDPSLPPIPADRAQLLQAVSNIIKNAAEAAPRQGAEIKLKTAFRSGIKIALASGARESLPLEVTITDNGPGVPEDLLPHIFEPFVTSKSSGSGLGLALVAKIISDHGGVIECLRGSDRTAFRIMLPVWAGPVPVDTEDDN